MPSQKLGTATASPLNAETSQSIGRCARTAALPRSASDNKMVRSIAASPSSSVAGARWAMSWVTGARVKNETPKSAWITLLSQITYCTGNG